jgi:hypothetical protein
MCLQMRLQLNSPVHCISSHISRILTTIPFPDSSTGKCIAF